MKAIYRIIIAIFTTAALTVSCSKELVTGDEAATSDLRVITFSFEDSTKSTLDGLALKLSDGDKILLSNGIRKEECTITVADGKATATTRLEGILKAIYPASAAVLSGNDITGFKVPSTQDGTFRGASIATAHNIISGAVLQLQVSILKFYVDHSIDVRSITVTSSENNIATEGSDLRQITIGNGSRPLHLVTDDPQKRVCYMAVLPGVPASSLKFTSVTGSQGTVERQSPASTVTLARNAIYKAFIPYYVDLGTAGRWGYCNVGAFLPEDFGTHFSWGNTVNDGGGKYSGSALPINATYDAAVKHWGSSWRMATGNGGEFGVLVDKTNKGWEPLNGVNGYMFKNKSNDDIYVFLPATFESATRGMYWSRNRRSGQTNTASQLDFTATYVDPGRSHQSKFYRGRPIRPIYVGSAQNTGIPSTAPGDIGEGSTDDWYI